MTNSLLRLCSATLLLLVAVASSRHVSSQDPAPPQGIAPLAGHYEIQKVDGSPVEAGAVWTERIVRIPGTATWVSTVYRDTGEGPVIVTSEASTYVYVFMGSEIHFWNSDGNEGSLQPLPGGNWQSTMTTGRSAGTTTKLARIT